MKKYYLGLSIVIILTMVILSLGYSSVLNKSTDTLKLAMVNTNINNFETTTLNETPYTQKDFPKGIVVVEVFASWCIPCRTSYPEIVKFSKKNVDKNISVIGIAYEDVSFEIENFEKQYGKLDTVIMTNVKVKDAFSLRSVPQTLIVKDKKVRYKIYGSPKSSDIDKVINLL